MKYTFCVSGQHGPGGGHRRPHRDPGAGHHQGCRLVLCGYRYMLHSRRGVGILCEDDILTAEINVKCH